MTRIKWSKGPDAWYCSYGTCCKCNTEFMCSKAHYCPGCGKKIESETKARGPLFKFLTEGSLQKRKLEKPYCKNDPKESEE